jgi:hypothetical protein
MNSANKASNSSGTGTARSNAGMQTLVVTEELGKGRPVSLRHDPQGGQRLLQYRQPPMNPLMRRCLAEAEQFAHHGLQRIGLLIHPDEQQFLFWRIQLTASPASDASSALVSSQRPVTLMRSTISLVEWR